MNRPAKIILKTVLVGLTLIIAVAIYLVATFDPNKYRDTITEQVRAATGRTLTLAEPLSLHLFPWIGIELGAVQLSGPEHAPDQDFIAVNKASIKARILPLLQQRLEVDTIILDGLTANLITTKEGRNNWDFGTATSDNTPAKSTTNNPEADHSTIVLARLAINGVDIRNTTINWDDASNNQQFRLTNLSLLTGQIRANSPIPVNLQTTISGSPLQGQQVRFALDTRLNISANAQAITLDQTRLQADDLVITTRLNARFATNQVAPNQSDSITFNGQLTLAAFNPHNIHSRFKLDTPVMSDDKALTQAALEFGFNGDAEQINISDLSLKLDDTTVTGTAHSTFTPELASTFDLAIDQLDLDRYLPPAESASGSADSTAAGTETADQTLDLLLDQPLDIPSEALRSLTINGQLSIGELIVSGLKTRNISTTLNSAKGIIRLAPVTAELYQGTTHAELQLDVRQSLPRIEVQQQLSGFQALPFMQDLMDSDLISGKADVDTRLTTAGHSIRELIRQLNGTTAVKFTDGAIKGVNFADMARRAEAKLKKQPVPDKAVEQTDFTALQATVQIKNGIATNNDLSALSPFVRLAGHGSADLNKQSIDYHVDASLVKDSQGQGGADLSQIRGTTFPIRIRGPLAEPEIKLDSVAVREELKDKAKAKIKDKVDDKLEQKQEQLKTDVQEKAKSVVNDKLNQKLKSLF